MGLRYHFPSLGFVPEPTVLVYLLRVMSQLLNSIAPVGPAQLCLGGAGYIVRCKRKAPDDPLL
jgi:hypothetical protein